MTRVMLATVLSLGVAIGAAAQTPPAARPSTPTAPPAQAPAAPRPAPPAPAATSAPAPAPAPVLPFPADSKVGFVNVQLIVGQSKLGKSGQDRMKELNDRKAGELAAQNKLVQTAQAEIDAGAAVLSAAALAQRKAELDRLSRETQFKQEQAQADVQALNDTLMEEFQQKVQPIIEQVRAEKNLWVIFSTVDAGVAAMNPALDLSPEVIKRLDAATK